MKKHYLLIAMLIISLLFGTYTFFNQKQKVQVADERFIQCIDKAGSGFAVDYTNIDEDTKNYYFTMIISNLHTAMNILPFTSYANVETSGENSANAISRLYLSMSVQTTPESTNRWRAVTEKREDIYKCLNNISTNPNDKSSWEVLSEIASDIGY